MIVPGSLRTLIVDDNGYARAIATAGLIKLGIGTIDQAEDGASALIMLLETRYNLIITDWYMPEVSGAGLMRVLRAPQFGPGRTTPVIMMTAYANAENLALARALGVNDILLKPFTTEQLARSIGTVLVEIAVSHDTGERDPVFV